MLRRYCFIACSPGRSHRHRIAHRPAAMLKTAAEVLVGPTRCLHHAIQRQVFDHNDLAHVQLLSARGAPAPCWLLTLYTNGVRLDRHRAGRGAKNSGRDATADSAEGE